MVSREKIDEFAERIVRRFHPCKVILFGSYAWGNPSADSDIDLLVVMPGGESGPTVAGRIRAACPRDFSLDLLVRTSAELRERLRMGDFFMHEVTTKGIVLHESRYARVG